MAISNQAEPGLKLSAVGEYISGSGSLNKIAEKYGVYRSSLLYMYQKDHADGEGKCWPGIRTISAELQLSCSTVKRVLEQHEIYKGAESRFPAYNPNLCGLLVFRISLWHFHAGQIQGHGLETVLSDLRYV